MRCARCLFISPENKREKESCLLAEDVIQSAKWEENSGGLQVWPASQESVRSSEMTPLHRQWP